MGLIRDVGRLAKGAATSILRKNLTRVAGNIGAVLGGAVSGDSSDYTKINRSKQDTNMLSFPIDVANADPGLGNHGHYIMFYINEQMPVKLGWAELAEKSNMKKAIQNIKTAEDIRNAKGKMENLSNILHGQDFAKARQKLINAGVGAGGTPGKVKANRNKGNTHAKMGGNTVYVKRHPTRRLDTVITMFMPPNIKTLYKANYIDTSIGSGTKLLVEGYKDLMSEAPGAVDAFRKNAGELAGSLGIQAGLQIAAGIPVLGGVKEAVEMQKGQIISDRMELAFKGIDKRRFSYEFKMIPRSEKEADEIREIIQMFKNHMLPSMSETAHSYGRVMNVPSTFDIEYMYQNAKNNYLNHISTCFLESMDVSYGGTRFTAHDASRFGSAPVETTITLQFNEIELITREKSADGF